MDKEMKQLLKEHSKVMEKLEKKIATLKDYGNECKCDKPTETIDIVWKGNWKELHTVCVFCGGFVENY